ncbi:MAG: helix-turn-helix transcriptional regulator [Longicatena sp.]
MLNIGGIIKVQMIRKNMQQKDLANALNLDQRTISSYCNDRSLPDIYTLSKLCKILDIDIKKLLDLSENGDSPLMVQSEQEYLLINTFRNISKDKKKEFVTSVITLGNLIK